VKEAGEQPGQGIACVAVLLSAGVAGYLVRPATARWTYGFARVGMRVKVVARS
jgi:hypothetical protein